MTATYRGYTFEQVARTIDHSILKPDHRYSDVENGAEVALKFNTASLCIRPMDVAKAAKLLAGSDVAVCTVIGFPHGSVTTATKVFETQDAIQNGATEVDMVLNISALLSGDFAFVEEDIRAVAEAAHSKGVSVKVIFETAFLNDDLVIKACQLTEAAGADYVKTSTGFASEGATLHNIQLMKATVGDRLKVKSSGGVRTLDQLIDFMDAGVSRSGSSATEAILAEFLEKAE
ncbi:deoxyribose-phosphate aldolase [Candidatus Rhodoluna planktonica]|uniref:Deoxyribose-phosphate aldolase n=1 Tax=Candidatus Rhodoluna planktonica TaxID=535712 RepID=A0A1D9DYQ4_9MICO|nr:deoxyribose-phosphate aldolase [Candidatus Rhodoluna planktonica]AOY55932.1 2-deoxyribose-5-phosphate aldolase [Candidatus Rhodoluna planktonica]